MKARTLLSHAPAAFALLLWFGATFYFLGDTGKHSDDYTVAMRNSATGSIDLSYHPWIRWPYFWRPLHLAHASAINTISWNHPWIGHLELAIVHGLVAWMLSGFLQRLGVRPRIAWCASLLFLVCPLNAEATLWTTASCNAISCIFLLATLELVRRQGEGPASTARLWLIAALAFITACWYEPAAAALAAVPPVFIAAGLGTLRSRLLGMVRCTLAAGGGCLLYIGLLVATAPPRNRGGVESMISLHELPSRSRLIFHEAFHAIIGQRGHDLFAGSLEFGWKSLHTPFGFILIACTLLLALLAGFGALCNSQPSVDVAPARSSSRGGILLAGSLMFLCAWIPIIAVSDQAIELRTLYVPVLGLAVMGAALANGLANLTVARLPSTRRGIEAFALCAVISVALPSAAGMIGFQAEFRQNDLHDHNTVEQLKRLVPDPPANTLFLPLRVATHGADTGRPCFDTAIHGVFDAPWSCRGIVHQVFHRGDVAGTPVPYWIKNLDTHGFTFLRLPGVQAWNRCVPFVVDRRGNVHLVRRITVLPGQGSPFVVEFPRVPTDVPADDSASIQLREVDHGSSAAHCAADVPGA